MANQITNKAKTLARILSANGLTKIAECQDIESTTPVAGQDDRGKEETQEIHKNIEGVNADTSAAANKPKENVDTPPNCQDLNKPAEAALASTGTSEKTQSQDGCPATFPKSAADYRGRLAQILAGARMSKKAAADELAENFRTGTEVMQKLAALSDKSTEAELAEAQDDLVKLAATNPLFTVCRDRILQQKLAADIDAYAEAEGVSPDEAAAALDEAAAVDPSIMQEANDEADGEAVAELADAESQADEMMAGVQQLADNASQAIGAEVTPEDIMNAIDEVEAQAEQLGVPPEALIQAAMEDMQGASGVSPEDEANAQAILDEAAANGVSPDEVLQMAAEQLGGEAPATEPAAAESEAAKPAAAESEAAKPATDEKPAEEGEKKEAGLKAATSRAQRAREILAARRK